jgi:ankyrin repeat protein
VNTQNAHGDAPLHVAVRHGQVELCSALLENGVDPNLANADGNNALHVAVAHGQVEVTRLLLVTSDDRRPVDYFAFNKRF